MKKFTNISLKTATGTEEKGKIGVINSNCGEKLENKINKKIKKIIFSL